MRADTFLLDRSEAPLDEDEIREALAAALTQQAPPALVRLVGKQAYSRRALLLGHSGLIPATCRAHLTGRGDGGSSSDSER